LIAHIRRRSINSPGTGLMFETFTIQESRDSRLMLTETQAAALNSLGRELAAKSEFFLPQEEDGSDEDGSTERTVIRCASVGKGAYQVRVSNAIGTVALPGGSLYIIPKIPISHFAHIARRSFAAPRLGDDAIAVESLDAFWELVSSWCVSAVEAVVRGGLLVDYRDETDDLPVIRGRVNVRESTQQFLHGQLRANCTFDELDLDHPLNRVLRAAVRMIAGHPSISSEDLSRRASRLDRMMDGVGPIRPGDIDTQLDRRTFHYSEAIDLSRRVLAVLGTNVSAGFNIGRTFLIPTPGLIEDGIRAILQSALAPDSVVKKGKQMEGDRFFSVNPDLVFGHGIAVGDVKYKVAKKSWNRSEVQQIAMFAAGFQTSVALIVTFSCDSTVGDISMTLGDVNLRRIVWISSGDVLPEEAQTDFVQRVRSFVAIHSSMSNAA